MSIINAKVVKLNNQLCTLSSSAIKLAPPQHHRVGKVLKKKPISRNKMRLPSDEEIIMPSKQLDFSQDSKKSLQKKERKHDLSPFRRYKTQSLKNCKKFSLKNIFNRLSLDLQAQKEKEAEQAEQRSSRPSHPVIFIKDFSEQMNRNKVEANILYRYRAAQMNKLNYLLTPLSREEEEKSKIEKQKQPQSKPLKKLFNLPIIRNKTEMRHIRQNKHKSLLLDIEHSLLVVDKKVSIERSRIHHKSKDKLEVLKKRKKKGSPFERPLSPWAESVPITNDYFYP